MFGKDFLWGTATAAYQIEGGYNADGKGVSIWDDFAHSGLIANGESGDVSCDHYHRYEEDIELMAKLGVNAYRFSIAWTRILPNGIGKVNQAGIDFYNKLIDCLIAHNITPMATLFHWDYPSALQKKGAWCNSESSDWFAEYAKVCFENFSDRVKYFITFNEPQCFFGNGYINGGNNTPPALKYSFRDSVPMVHNILLSHGKAVKLLREIAPYCKIGIAPTATVYIPETDSKENIEAARRRYFDVVEESWTWNVAWWSDPILLGKYPDDSTVFNKIKEFLPQNYEEDLKLISLPIDFYGQNIYGGEICRADENGNFKSVNYSLNTPVNSLGWKLVPEGLYWGPKFLYERYKTPIIITECGMCCHDSVSSDGKVHDPNRITFLETYLKQLEKATDDGIDVRGFCYWAFADNLEWNLGFAPRFGLIYSDFETQKRIPKDSYYWYSDFVKKQKKFYSKG